MYRDLTKRIMALALSVCMIAGMVDLSGLTVHAANETLGWEVVIDKSDLTYDGKAKEPGVTVTDVGSGQTLTEGTDYDLEYQNNVNAGNATVVIINHNDTSDRLPMPFTIEAKNIADCTGLPTIPTQEISKADTTVTPRIDITDQVYNSSGTLVEKTLVNNTDYTYKFQNNTGEGTASVVITGKNGGNYTGTHTIQFQIVMLSGEKLHVVYDDAVENNRGKPYTGSAIEVGIKSVTYGEGADAVTLTSDEYTQHHQYNTQAGVNTAETWIVGKGGRFDGLESEHKKFSITKFISSRYNPSSLNIQASIPDQPYAGGTPVTVKSEDIVLTDPDGDRRLELGKDFEIDTSQGVNGYKNNTNEVDEALGYTVATVSLHGIGCYTGYLDVNFKIVAAGLSSCEIKTDSKTYTYNGADQFDQVKTDLIVRNGDITYDLSPDGRRGDYTVEAVPGDNTTAGTHTVIVTPVLGGRLIGNPRRVTYRIEPRPLNSTGMQLTTGSYVHEYDGSAKTPDLNISYTPAGGTPLTLEKGKDYRTVLEYTNNTNAGTAKVRAEGMGNYTGLSDWCEFPIDPISLNDSNTELTGIEDNMEHIYSAAPYEPNVNVKHIGTNGTNGRGNLRKGTDYTITYENNENVGLRGEAKVKITGIGNFRGDFEKSFTIVPRPVTDQAVSIRFPSTKEYTGRPIEPGNGDNDEVVITHGGKTLTKGTDYRLSYGSNTEKGPGTITVTGMGNYSGSVEKTFEITARNIARGTLSIRDESHSPVYDFTTGTANDRFYAFTKEPGGVKFPLAVAYTNDEMNNVSLTPGTDYTLSFDRNTAIGTNAQVTITGTGNYTGSKTVNFAIKGDFSDYNNSSDALTKITIPEQVYTSKEILPTDTQVSFNNVPLTNNRDYQVVDGNNNINAGENNATVTIRGIGNYFNDAEQVPFSIRKFNLSTDIDALPNNKYAINNIDQTYTFCDTDYPIEPKPVITHNGTELENNIDYRVDYGNDDNDNNKVGTGTLVVNGIDPNYEGSKRIDFTIEPYDLGTGQENGRVEVEGIADVILDEVIAGNDSNANMLEDKQIVMSNLDVKYTRVDLEGNELGERYLAYGTEYTAVYSNNRKIGEATITIRGIGNFGGTITKTFRIRGDLSSDRTSVSVDDCVYTPAGNEPVPTVTYTYDNGDTETLQAGEDYAVRYENNENATVKNDTPSGTPAKVIITPVYEADNTTIKGNYAQSGTDPRSAEFEIFQRDLSNAIEGEGIEKDPSLDVSGLVEDGYEYNGTAIVPELEIKCDEEKLALDGDYTISAVNNTDVYTFDIGENGERGDRLMPTVTVSAVQDGDGKYTGNYKGQFQMEFVINPREISADTITTKLWVNGESKDDSQVPEVKYTGEAITFPLNTGDPSENRNDITVNWKTQVEPLVENKDYKVTYEDNVRIGEAKVVISEVEYSNYKGEYKRPFKIMASIEVVDDPNPPLRYMTLDYNHNVPFGIVDVYPDMIFTDTSGASGEMPYILQEGKDFEIVTTANQGSSPQVSVNNKNVASETAEEASRPTVVIRGIGCYFGEIKRYYNIIPKDLAADVDDDITIEFEGALNTEDYENAFIYTGQAIEPTVKVYNHGQLMEPDVDYTVAGYLNNTAISTETQKASVVIRAVPGGNYLNQKTFNFNIIRRPIEGMQVTITSDAQVYSRTPKTPEVEVSYLDGGERVVLGKNNYDVTYENNVNAATEFAGESAPTIIVTGKGSYGGTVKKAFTIAPEPLDESNDDFNITTQDVPYTGLACETTITVKAKDGTTLEPDTDYVISGYKDNTNAGTAYITIRGNGNYTGTRDVPFRIIAPDVSENFRISEIPDQVYTGNPIEPDVTVEVAVGESLIKLGTDEYELEYENNINAGTATVIVRGTRNYGGEARVTFAITPRSIGTLEDGIASDMTLAAIEDQLYTGKGVTPDVSLTFHKQAVQRAENDELLVLGRDYTLSYLTNVPVGTASVTVTGIGNYKGNIQTQFKILGPMNLASVPKINAQPYTGSAVTPKPTVSLAGKTLKEGEDYTLDYADNVAQGTATITITGMGWYTGEKKVTFEIARDFSSDTTVRGMASAYTYTGKAITPAVLVEDHGRILSKGTDYKVSYSNNINVGTATVTVTGIGAYSGTASAQFKITPQNIGRATVSKVADQTYDKKKKKPSVTVSSGGITLKSGTDYTVLHVDNKDPGKASVVVKGKGNFTGSQTVNYSIIVPKVTGVKVSSYTNNSITFSWKRNKVVSGYEIYNSKNKRVARVTKNSTVKATVSKLKTGSSDTFKVRAFVIRGQYYYSSFVKIKAGTAPKATSITSISSSKSKQVALKWKKIKGASQYQVYRSTSQNGKYKKIGTTKKTSYTDKKASGGKTYYYKIRVGKKIGSKTYYSYSSVKSVTAKK